MAESNVPPTTAEELRAAILARYESLSKRLQQIARYVLDEPNAVALETLAVLAERTGVQPSAIVRFAKYFGFDGATQMQRLFRDGLLSGTAPLGYSERVREFTPERVAEMKRLNPTVAQPIVRVHPESGRKALYVNADYTKYFDGMTEQESAPLLRFLYDHACRPEFTCRHRWRDGDILMWDNRVVQHAVIGDVGGAERVLHRVTIEGEIPE